MLSLFIVTNIYYHKSIKELPSTRSKHYDTLCSYIFIAERQNNDHMTNFCLSEISAKQQPGEGS